jgi:serine protease Do
MVMRHLKIERNSISRIPKPLFFKHALLTAAFLWLFLTGVAPNSMVMAASPGSFSDLVKKVSPSVVNITVVKLVKSAEMGTMPFGPGDPFNDYFDRYFGGQMPKEYKQKGLGTGFIIDQDGYILTNNHVVEQADELSVKLADGTEYKAKAIGRDPKTDLALIKIEPKAALAPLTLGDSDQLAVGDWVVAIGNPFGLGNTVTAGIVSAKFRNIGAGPYDNFIQTDASINPGNSGGPLLDVSGQVVGINSAIFSQSGGSVGIGFAIPVNMAKQLLPQLKKGKVIRGWLGVIIQQVTPELKNKLGLEEAKGALVSDVSADGPAAKGGIKRGDVIVAFDGKEINDSKELPYIVASTPIGKAVTLELVRNKEKKSLQVTVAELKEAELAKSENVSTHLGLSVQEVTPELANQLGLSDTKGIVVLRVEPGSPAEEAGFSPGDIILEVDQVPVTTLGEYKNQTGKSKIGEAILFLVKREDITTYLTIKVPK